jgi:hypothetical protein
MNSFYHSVECSFIYQISSIYNAYMFGTYIFTIAYYSFIIVGMIFVILVHACTHTDLPNDREVYTKASSRVCPKKNQRNDILILFQVQEKYHPSCRENHRDHKVLCQ